MQLGTDKNGSALRKAMKAAIVETLQEQRDLLRAVFAEAPEDGALAEAIREGQTTKPASRSEILRILGDEGREAKPQIRRQAAKTIQ